MRRHWIRVKFASGLTCQVSSRIGHQVYDIKIKCVISFIDQQIGIILTRDLQLSYKDFAQSFLNSCNENPKLGDVPIQFKDPVYGSSEPSFTDFVAPGVILT